MRTTLVIPRKEAEPTLCNNNSRSEVLPTISWKEAEPCCGEGLELGIFLDPGFDENNLIRKEGNLVVWFPSKYGSHHPSEFSTICVDNTD